MIQTLQIVAAVGTVLTGLFSLFKPNDIKGFTGIRAEGGRGTTEVRAIFGGAFIALGALPFFFPAAYFILGATYLVIAATRAVSMFLDKSFERSNILSLAVEIVFGIVLCL